ncbi:NAD(P)H-binding protein [Deinococcus ruber]|uniref:NAD-dependent dehydratase n=1 Tax=Deinococcus ruber TaxID=1848197 RepID=A0A918FHB1_9DEIO|nr:NAD(P)H-binding protein [Deinococcus ruber]GGR37688.1 NAD-dependent dehydratase [Deinococcus ruber]
MTRILILGANGGLARHATRQLLEHSDAELTLYLRQASRLKNPDPKRVRIIEGDVLDGQTLEGAVQGQDVVYANLSGEMARQATAIVQAMHRAGLRRLIFVSSMGIYGEVPGQPYSRMLDPYRDSAAIIEASDLDYTLLWPGWFTQKNEVKYQLTQKGEPFRGHDISMDSLADLILQLALDPQLHVRESLGVSRG